MANLSWWSGSSYISISPDFLRTIDRLERNFPDICADVLRAGSEIVEARVSRNLQGVIGQDKYKQRSTGTLLASVGVTEAKKDKSGHYNVRVGFAEPRRGGGDPNGKIANVIEYGSHVVERPARPFMMPAKSATEQEAVAAMQRKLDEYVGRYQ